MAIRWDRATKRFRNEYGAFVSRAAGMRSSVARSQFLKRKRRKKIVKSAEDQWYYTDAAREFFALVDRVIKPLEPPPQQPRAPIITEVGTGFEDEEIEVNLRKRRVGLLSEYLERYIYDRDDLDADQDDPYDW